MHALGLFIEILSIFLLVAIILRIVFSWTGFDQRSPIYAAILEVTEPILAPIRSVLPRTGMLCRLPMRRPGYITGTLRRPCCTYTIAKIVNNAITRKKISDRIAFC